MDIDEKNKLHLFQKKLGMYLKCEHTYNALLYGQYTPLLFSSIKSQQGFANEDDEQDIMWLMNVIKNLSVGIDDNKNEAVTAHDALKKFFLMYQSPRESIDDYLDRLEELF